MSKKEVKPLTKYIALKGTYADDSFLSRMKASAEEAMKGALKGGYFYENDNVIVYEITMKPVKKGKVVLELKNE